MATAQPAPPAEGGTTEGDPRAPLWTWFSLATLGRLSTSGVTLATVGGLLIAGLALIYYQPDVKLDATSASFIDMAVLEEQYAPRTPPPILIQTARAYNEANARDLNAGLNATGDALHTSDLCASVKPRRLAAVSPSTECGEDGARIGRNRYYERLLLCRNEEALTGETVCVFSSETDPLASDGEFSDLPGLRGETLTRAVEALRSAEYQRAKVVVVNVGRGAARNVVISPSDGFSASVESALVPFTLAPTRAPGFSPEATTTTADPTTTSDPDGSEVDPATDLVALAQQLDSWDADQRRANRPDLPVVRSFETPRGANDGLFGITRPNDRAGRSFLSFRASWEPANRLEDDWPALTIALVLAALWLGFGVGDFLSYRNRAPAKD